MGEIRIGAVVFGVLLLAGCASEPLTSAHPDVLPSPTMDVPNASAVDRPLYGGDCQSLLSDASVSKAFGRSEQVNSQSMDPYGWVVNAHGGLICQWGATSETTDVIIVAVPTDGLADDIRSTPPTKRNCASDADTSTCFSLTVGSVWLSGVAYGDGAADASSSLTAELAKTAPVDFSWTVPSGAWPTVMDCGRLGPAIDTAALLGGPRLDAMNFQSSNDMPAAGFQALLHKPGHSFCYWAEPDAQAGSLGTYAVAGAGAAVVSRASDPAADPVTVAGATVAYIIANPQARLYATDGANAIAIQGAGIELPSNAPAVAAALLTAIGAR